MKIVIVQRDFWVGDIDGNVDRILAAAEDARSLQPDVLVFPELCLTGYPPEDLLLRSGFLDASERAMQQLIHHQWDCPVIVGYPRREGDRLFNCAAMLFGGGVLTRADKQCLPNYAVFDEKRYFDAGAPGKVIEWCGVKLGLAVCEDVWEIEPIQALAQAGANLVLIPNASPYHCRKREMRAHTLSMRARDNAVGLVYCNLVGGQDELVFDGQSLCADATGALTLVGRSFTDELVAVDFAEGAFAAQAQAALSPNAEIYAALVRGTRDYIHKNGFSQVLIGLSGGIDSALTAAIAVDALGADNVHCVMLDSQYTSELSLALAAEQARLLGTSLDRMSISAGVAAIESTLNPIFGDQPADLTAENIQSRIRGLLLMSLSNNLGKLVLTTGNKSEYATGYATIYGDMVGAFAPIKDVSKTLVFELCNWLNQRRPTIAQGIIDRPPSAELRHDQKDSDSLPEYAILDAIIKRYVEDDMSVHEISAEGFERADVEHVARMVHLNEYKRRQSAPGVRITPRAFGRDRRYPITSRWKS